MFGKLKEFFSEEGSFKTEAENFVNVWSIKEGIAKPTAEEWAIIMNEAKADGYEGKMGLNKEGTAFTYRSSKDINWAGGGGGGITTTASF